MISIIYLFCVQLFNSSFRDLNFSRACDVGSKCAPSVPGGLEGMGEASEKGALWHTGSGRAVNATFWFSMLKSYLLSPPFLLACLTGVEADFKHRELQREFSLEKES